MLMEFKNIEAKDLCDALDLFGHVEKKEQQFVEDADEKGATYSIVIEEKIDHDTFKGVIYEDIWNSSNGVFFNVTIYDYDLEKLKKIGTLQQ